MTERTFAMIKPDAMEAGNAGKIIDIIQSKGFRILGMKMVRLNRDTAAGFYADHQGKPFYEGLVEFMTTGPAIALVLDAPDAIRTWREIMGSTDSAQAPEGTIRRLYGTNNRRNATHGSDSVESARREIAYFFAESELDRRP